jgi:flavodoxin
MKMKALVLYYSKYGNTRRLAEAIAEELNQSMPTRVLGLDNSTQHDLETADIIVIGSPTHFQAVPKNVRIFMKSIPKNAFAGKWVASYDTSLHMWQPIMLLTAAHGLMSRLRKLGGRKVVKPMTFIVNSTETPTEGEIDLLSEGEFNRGVQWAQMIKQRVLTQGAI